MPNSSLRTAGGGDAASSSPVFSHTPPRRGSDDGIDQREANSAFTLRYLFPFILLTQVIVYLEAGAVPALLNQISGVFEMSYWLGGVMGGIGYLCLSLGCPVATWAFRSYEVPYVLGMSILLNAAATAVFALTPSSPAWVALLVLSRGVIGFTQAFPIIFFPLWCDAHAPANRKATWLSLVQGGVVIGILLGYAAATVTFLLPDCGRIECWRVPFIAQALLTLPLATMAFAIPAEHCNIKGEHHGAGGGAEGSATPILVKRRLSMQQHQQQQAVALGGTHVPEVPDSASQGAHLVANVHSILAPLAVLPSEMPLHPEGELPNANPSPWPTPKGRSAGGRRGEWGGGEGTEEGDEDEDEDEDDEENGGLQPANSTSYQQDDASRSGQIVAASSAVLSHESSRGARSLSHAGGASSLVWHTTTTLEGLNLLASNTVYVLVVLSLSCGYFSVIGISFWGSSYFISVLGGEESLVRTGYLVCAITAPVGGVVFGGVVVDRAGGYSGLQQRTEALRWCSGFLAVGALFALVACLAPGSSWGGGVLPSGIALWLVLFFGSAALPPATGVMLNSVHPDMRAFAASVATISFNVLGYMGGPLLSGAVMTWSSSFLEGFRVVLYAALPCLLLMMAAWGISRSQRKARRRAMARWAEHEQAAAAAVAAAATTKGGHPQATRAFY